jgi:ribonuclease Z
MRPSLNPRLINGPFDDPGLYISFLFQNRAILFDLGDLSALSPRELLKISHVFVTHTHMDHFIGFDRLLRLNIGRRRNLHLFGPDGFLKNLEGRLAGYTWNLVQNYAESVTLITTEIRSDRMLTARYPCRHRFRQQGDLATKPFEGILYQEPALTVSAVELDHGIPCLGFLIEERYHINIRKDGLANLGLSPGPWLQNFKQALYAGLEPESVIAAGRMDGEKPKAFRLCDLVQEIALITPGQKIGYIVDVGYSQANVEKIVSFVDGADHLFIEAAFLKAHADIAGEKNHLTAHQAGMIAGLARVRNFTVFHFSPRYLDQTDRLASEARKAYEETYRPDEA